MANPFDIASSQVGLREGPDRAAIKDYLTTGGVNLDPATLAWCAAFVNSSLAQAGLKGTGSNLARSFLNYGEAVDKPQRGDLAVFSRGDPNGPFGHVGFFDSVNPDGTIRVLGGNQSDSVSFANYGTDRLLGYRRPTGAPAAIGDVVAGKPAVATTPTSGPATATPAAPVAAIGSFGDLIAPTAAPDFGSVVAGFLQNRQKRDQQEEADKARRTALFAQPSPFG
jgi:uncharacterized protein (TIGR02594 family)